MPDQIPAPPESQQVLSRPIGTPYDSTRVTPDSLGPGAQIGQALQGAGKDADEAIATARANAQASATTDGLTHITAALNHIGYDTEIDPATGQAKGLFNRKGQFAQDGYQPALDAAQKIVDQTIADAPDPGVQRMLRMHAPALLEDFNRQAARHIGEQIEVTYKQANETRLSVGLDAVANAWSDPEARAQAISKLQPFARIAAMQQGAADNGDATWLSVQKEAAQKIAAQYLAHLDGAGAQQFLGSQLLPGQKDAAGNPLTVEKLLGSDGTGLVHQAAPIAAAQAGEVVARNVMNEAAKGDDGNVLKSSTGIPLVNEAKALALVNAMPPGPVKDDALERVKQKIQDNKVALSASSDQPFQRAFAAVSQGKPVDPRDKAFLLDPTNDATQKWAVVQAHQRQLAEEAANPVETPQQQLDMAALRMEIAQNPYKFADPAYGGVAGLWKDFGSGQLTRKQLDEAGTLLAGATARVREEQKTGVLPKDYNDVLLEELRASSIINIQDTKTPRDSWAVEKGAPSKAALYNLASSQLAQQVADYKAQHAGKAPALLDVQGWAKQLLAKGYVPNPGIFGFILGGSTTRLQAQAEGHESEFVANPAPGQDVGEWAKSVTAKKAAPPAKPAAAAAPSAASSYRYSADRKRRVPVDAKGNPTGPIEVL